MKLSRITIHKNGRCKAHGGTTLLPGRRRRRGRFVLINIARPMHPAISERFLGRPGDFAVISEGVIPGNGRIIGSW
ncbi:MAG TPA: hypothetical protein PKV82_06610 [Anaerolineae bacterium]|nr:hypothetical protein [Anaerolineae bacterium]